MNKLFITGLVFMFLVSCNNDYYPKPTGYFRIDLPEKQYQTIADSFPYSFEYPIYGEIQSYSGLEKKDEWINIVFSDYKAKIYISYEQSEQNINGLFEDARTLVYKHTIKADAISEKTFINNEKKVYGILYDIKGDAASSVQFFLTDSTSKFFRGALYFNTEPNKDSLKPVIEFFREDIIHLIESFHWI